MAATVAAPLERRLGEISGVTEMTSVSSLGLSRITIQFDLNRSIDGAARDVQAALNAALADLPGDLPSLPTFRKATHRRPDPDSCTHIEDLQPSAIYDAADSVIAQRLSQVDGVADVTVAGSEQPGHPSKRRPGAIVGDGPFAGRRPHCHLQFKCGWPSWILRWQQAGHHDRHQRPAARCRPVRSGCRQDGQRYGHSSVERCHHSPSVRNTRSAGWFNGDPSVLLIITKQGNANVIDTVDRIYELLPEIRQWVPEGLDISVLSDRTQTIRASVHDMQLTLAATIATRDAGRVFVSAARGTDRGSRRDRSARPLRHLRSHVGRGLFNRQPLTDGIGGQRRLRGR
jgi:multidrug efflux pump